MAYVAASSATWVILEHPSESHAAASESLTWNRAGHVSWGMNMATDYTVSLNT